MLTPNAKILVGCNELHVTQAVKLLLGDSCEVIERTSFAELVREAGTEGYDAVIFYGNCLSSPRVCEGGLLENSTHAIKTIRASRAVPIIALTSMADWCEPLRAAGADVCLETPFDAAEFRAALPGGVQRRVGVGEPATGQAHGGKAFR